MLRSTKIYLIAFAVVAYGLLAPIGSLVDTLLFFHTKDAFIPYLYQNIYEATLFFGGVGAGMWIMRNDEKLRDKK